MSTAPKPFSLVYVWPNICIIPFWAFKSFTKSPVRRNIFISSSVPWIQKKYDTWSSDYILYSSLN